MVFPNSSEQHLNGAKQLLVELGNAAIGRTEQCSHWSEHCHVTTCIKGASTKARIRRFTLTRDSFNIFQSQNTFNQLDIFG